MTTNKCVSRDKLLKKLKTWFVKNKGKTKITIVISRKECASNATANVKLNDNNNVISIPKSLLIVADDVYHLPIWNTNIRYSNINNKSKLAIAVLWHKNKGTKSFFNHYINILPKNLKHIPIFWTKKVKNLVENTYFGLLLQNRKIELDNEYNDVKKCLNGKLKITKKEFMWARHIVGSRNFGIMINGISKNILAPFGDMLNHSDTNNVSWSFNDNSNAFEFKSNRIILKNEIINITYGKTKMDYYVLLYYGFFPQRNRQIIFDGYVLSNIKQNLPKSVKKKIKKHLDSFPTTLEQDIKTYKTMNTSKESNLIVATKVLINEKEILNLHI